MDMDGFKITPKRLNPLMTHPHYQTRPSNLEVQTLPISQNTDYRVKYSQKAISNTREADRTTMLRKRHCTMIIGKLEAVAWRPVHTQTLSLDSSTLVFMNIWINGFFFFFFERLKTVLLVKWFWTIVCCFEL